MFRRQGRPLECVLDYFCLTVQFGFGAVSPNSHPAYTTSLTPKEDRILPTCGTGCIISDPVHLNRKKVGVLKRLKTKAGMTAYSSDL